jgi:hypothetical protein
VVEKAVVLTADLLIQVQSPQIPVNALSLIKTAEERTVSKEVLSRSPGIPQVAEMVNNGRNPSWNAKGGLYHRMEWICSESS